MKIMTAFEPSSSTNNNFLDPTTDFIKDHSNTLDSSLKSKIATIVHTTNPEPSAPDLDLDLDLDLDNLVDLNVFKNSPNSHDNNPTTKLIDDDDLMRLKEHVLNMKTK